MSADPSQKGKKQQKEKKPKKSKAERMAEREAAQRAKAAKQAATESSYKRPVIEHPDDGNYGDLTMIQSKYRV